MCKLQEEAMERAGDLKHSAHYYDTDRNKPLAGAALTAECAVLAEKVGAVVDRSGLFELDDLANACAECDVPDSTYESLCIALKSAAPVAQPSAQTTVPALVQRLREYADDPGYSHCDYADTMRQAADALASQEPSAQVQSKGGV